MTKEQYLGQLWDLLAPVPEQQRRDMMLDYEEHFRMTAEHGGTAEEAAAELGDPRVIAKELLLDYRVVEAEKSGGVVSISRAVMATVGMGFFNLIFVLGPYVGLLGVLIGLWGATLALALAPLAVMFEGVFGENLTLMQASFLSIGILGFAILFGAGTYKLTQGVFKLTLRYLRFNTRVMKGRKS
ncbi:HAAS signaling domain-containing protein [Paenibacillus sp. GCM10027626]|uniref:HAAS signaling domain-containing protein n=1 Tax=Paenibacillus sp. GCM10027626 TaxID=3273411 RepID=UPI00362831A9